MSTTKESVIVVVAVSPDPEAIDNSLTPPTAISKVLAADLYKPVSVSWLKVILGVKTDPSATYSLVVEAVPWISNWVWGLVVPMPTRPSDFIYNLLAPAVIRESVSEPSPPRPVLSSVKYGTKLGFVILGVSQSIAGPLSLAKSNPVERTRSLATVAKDNLISSSEFS